MTVPSYVLQCQREYDKIVEISEVDRSKVPLTHCDLYYVSSMTIKSQMTVL